MPGPKKPNSRKQDPKRQPAPEADTADRESISEEVAEIEAAAESSPNPYIKAVSNRSVNLQKRIKNANQLEQRSRSDSTPLLPNQQQAINEKPMCKFAVKEFDNLLKRFEEIDAQSKETRSTAFQGDLSILMAALLLPSYLAEPATELRTSALLKKTPLLSAEQLTLLAGIREMIIPSSFDQSLKQAVQERTTFLNNLLSGSKAVSPLGVPFSELKTLLTTLVTGAGYDSLPQVPKAPKAPKKKPTPPKATEAKAEAKPEEVKAPAAAPASAPAPEPAAAPAPAPSPPSESEQPKKSPRSKQSFVYKPQ